jgi:hypothetical protein
MYEKLTLLMRLVTLHVLLLLVFVSYIINTDRLWGPPSLLYNGYRGVLSPGVKARPGRDADHSPPSSVEVENE